MKHRLIIASAFLLTFSLMAADRNENLDSASALRKVVLKKVTQLMLKNTYQLGIEIGRRAMTLAEGECDEYFDLRVMIGKRVLTKPLQELLAQRTDDELADLFNCLDDPKFFKFLFYLAQIPFQFDELIENKKELIYIKDAQLNNDSLRKILIPYKPMLAKKLAGMPNAERIADSVLIHCAQEIDRRYSKQIKTLNRLETNYSDLKPGIKAIIDKNRVEIESRVQVQLGKDSE